MNSSKIPLLATTNFFCSLSSSAHKSPSRQFLTKAPPKPPFPKLSTATRNSLSDRRRNRRRRGNTLREKILKENPQVSQIPQLSDDLSNAHVEKLEETEERSSLSPLWDRLENWVDMYKEESELWGLGFRPIFTIYQDSDENVVRVFVDEEEIVRRSRVKAWSFEEREGAAEFEDVGAKISRARAIAEEIEKGEYSIPRNSSIAKIEKVEYSIPRNNSIAKFVVEEKKGSASESATSLVEGIRAASVHHKAALKALPWVGFAVLCGVGVFWATTKLFKRDEKVELKWEEVEMLRRKKESRMKRDRSENGSAKVLPEVEELPMAHIVRPQLDRDEMMKSIEQARMARESLPLSDSTSHFGAKNSEFDDKVREIREMARKAREAERQDRTQNDEQGEGDDFSSMLLASKSRTVVSDPYVKTKYAETGSDQDSVSQIDLAYGKNSELLKDIQNEKMVGENINNYVDLVPDGQSSDTFGTNSDMVSGEAVNSLVTGGKSMEHATDIKENVVDIEKGGIVGETNEDYTNNILEVESLKSSGTSRERMTDKVVKSLATNGKDMEHSEDIENKKLVREDGKDSTDIRPNLSPKLSGSNRDTVTSNGNAHQKGTVLFSRDMPTDFNGKNSVNRSIASTPSTKGFGNKDVREKKTKKINSEKASKNVLPRVSSSRKKPKIIRSVKQAREYLAGKNGTPAHEMQLKQGEQLKRPAVQTKGRPRPYDGKPDYRENQAENGTAKVVDSSKLSMSMTSGDVGSITLKKESQVGHDSGTKSHGDDTKNIEKNRVLQEGKVERGHDILIGKSEKSLRSNVVKHTSLVDDSETDKTIHSSKSLLGGGAVDNASRTSKPNDSGDEQRSTENQTWKDSYPWHVSDNKPASKSQGVSFDNLSIGSSIKDVTGMRENGDCCSQEFDNLSNKGHLDSKAQVSKLANGIGDCNDRLNETNVGKDRTELSDGKMVESADLNLLAGSSSEESVSREDKVLINASSLLVDAGISRDLEPPLDVPHESDGKHESGDPPRSKANSRLNSDGSDCQTGPSSLRAEKSWLEENFQQLDPIMKKIGDGFKDNYMVAKDKVQNDSGLSAKISELRSLGEYEELEWMKDEKLSEIVFKVRDNELAGRDPFHLMDADDQHAFFEGLERKAEKVNEKLLGVHEWVHSRIENLDYGTDGISLYDPVEKIVPRWKSPAIAKDPEFLNNHTAHKKVNFDGDVPSNIQKSEGSPISSSTSPSSLINERISTGTSASSKTLIECSDGSSRPGKKTGKEHWQHTKKWSQGFLDVYNAETDPEIKSIMRDMGKDLDRWSTEKDREDAADLMTKLPKRKRRYIEKKMDKLKRELEMYGPQAVVSKYREYSDEKEEDYLWWLDLQFVLCIELYTIEEDAAKIGFYSLEMAAELELDPKQYHVIAFEDPGDCKSLCYIIQAQMDLHGNDRAFVVARPPKDAFREAKANGFSVTVIKKGEVKLNVDQTLDEVEEKLVEIGSKIYHDKIMRERGVDIRTLKGVVGADKATKKKSKKMLASPGKSQSS
ncbi:uncharacterized protein M6B38_206890 [Iris pallida]|uniref:Uncharacterized protein n=1 Tax=Iris pallida TaxID=29817 RepID=A0AAX6E624_IRIPA|nr:uncharacterized protein M6B38_206890 [Iris pallida]